MSRNVFFEYGTRILAFVDCFYHKSGHQWLGDSRCIFHTEVVGTGHDSRFWERMLLTVDTQHRRAKLGKIDVKLDGEEWLRNVDNLVLIIVWDQFVYPFLTIIFF